MNRPAATSVVLVEDDPRLGELITRYLEGHGFRVAGIHRGDAVVEQVVREPPDIVILDLGLPGQDGFSVCRQLRQVYDNPILMLTARDSDGDQVLGLELGADDYVVKPVEPRVLMARINALLRRGTLRKAADGKRLEFGSLTIQLRSRSVLIGGRAVALSRNEFDLLVHLATHAGEVLSRESIFQQLYRREYDGVDRMLDVRISHLRKKLGDVAESSERIKTIWGQGYLFVADAW